MAIQIIISLALFVSFHLTGNLKFLVYVSGWFAISFGFDLLVLLIAIIQINIILRKNYPKLRPNQLSTFLHIIVGLITLLSLIISSFGVSKSYVSKFNFTFAL